MDTAVGSFCPWSTSETQNLACYPDHEARWLRDWQWRVPLLSIPVFWKRYECALPLYMQQILSACHKGKLNCPGSFYKVAALWMWCAKWPWTHWLSQTIQALVGGASSANHTNLWRTFLLEEGSTSASSIAGAEQKLGTNPLIMIISAACSYLPDWVTESYGPEPSSLATQHIDHLRNGCHIWAVCSGGMSFSDKTQGSMPFGWCHTTAIWIPSLFSTTKLAWHRKILEKHVKNQGLNQATTSAWYLGIQHFQHQGGTLPLSISKPGHLLSRFGGIQRIRICTD